MRSLVRLIGLITALAVVGSAPAVSQGRSVGLVRDAEIENIIRDYATPIFNAAGLDTTSVRIHLVNDERLNAFVAGGQRMFINTGLLMRASHPEEVIGVIAHEAGHIAGGHLARFQDELRNARTTSILSMILGTAAGLAARDGRVAGAVISGSNQALLRDLLKYSRTQESAADAAALKYLDQTGISARGLLEFFELLQRDVRLSGGREHPYLSTHPLTNDRMAAVSSHLALSRFADAGPSPDLARKHAYMRAKLIGFTEPLERTLEIYGDDDQSAPARYARATAYYLQSDLDRALPLIDGLIVEEPENPYFYELKGQMLLENGRVAESIVPYQRMVDLAPDEALLRMALAKAQVETGDKTLLSPALEHLQATVRLEPDLQGAWRLLTVVQGRLGNQGELALAQAEYALLGDDPKAAKAHAERAIELLPTGAPGWLRSQDIVSEADRQIEER